MTDIRAELRAILEKPLQPLTPEQRTRLNREQGDALQRIKTRAAKARGKKPGRVKQFWGRGQ